MKRFFIAIAVAFYCMQINSQTSILSFRNGEMAVDSSMVVPSEVYPIMEDRKPYVFKDSVAVDLKGYHYVVSLFNYNNYEMEIGKYHVLSCSVAQGNGQKQIAYQEESDEGWDPFFTSSGESGKPIDVHLFTDYAVCVLAGAIDASQPALNTVLVLKDGKAKVVYQSHSFINNVEQKNGKYIVHLQLNCVEYDENLKPYNPAELAKIEFSESGAVYMKE